MNAQSASQKKEKAYLRLLGNPYASLSLYDDPEAAAVAEPSIDQKRAYFKKLEDPHAFDSIFADADEDTGAQIQLRLTPKSVAVDDLEKELDEVLRLYKPYIARNEWSRVMDYRPIFLKQAGETTANSERVTNQLRKFRFSLSANEKVEHNRAPAARIIRELKKILV